MNPNLFQRVVPNAIRSWFFYRFARAGAKMGPYWLQFAPSTPLHEIVRTDHVGRAISFAGFYDWRLSRHIFSVGRIRGGLMVDVGANIGYFCHIWLAAKADNRVVAFEASPRVFPILVRNIQAHVGWSSRVTLHELAATNKNENLLFDVGPPEQTGWGGIASKDSSGHLVEVQAVRLDEILPPNTKVDFLKVDVEGADPLVILGAEGLLRNHSIRAGSFEINNVRQLKLGVNSDAAVKLLEDCGYIVDRYEEDCTFRLPDNL